MPLRTICETSPITNVPWVEDCEETLRSSSEAVTCLPHTVKTSLYPFLVLIVKQGSCEHQFL